MNNKKWILGLTGIIANIVVIVIGYKWYIRDKEYEPLSLLLATSIVLLGQLIYYCFAWKKTVSYKLLQRMTNPFKRYYFYSRPALKSEIESIYVLFQRIFGYDLLSLTALRKIFNKNNETIWLVGRADSKNKSKELRIGFFEFFPLNKSTAKKIATNTKDPRMFTPSDITSRLPLCKDFYIASIGVFINNGKVNKAMVMYQFKKLLYNINTRTEMRIFARPVTRDGLFLVKKYRFRQINQELPEMDSIWQLDLNKESLKHEGANIRF